MNPLAHESSAEHKPDANDLVVAIDGFDGPLDLLLTLAREQKVDLARLSILALAEQYLAFIASARQLRLEVAADYLVMAAWLAYLKSRLLLPEPPQDEADPADMAEALKFQLQRLEAMRQASQKLQDLPQLGSDTLLRGMPEALAIEDKPSYYLPLYDLLKALGAPQRRRKAENIRIKPTRLYSMEESLNRLRQMLGAMPDWTMLVSFLPEAVAEPLEARSAVASTFAAMLEMVKEGELECRQHGVFAPIYLRRRDNLFTFSESDKT